MSPSTSIPLQHHHHHPIPPAPYTNQHSTLRTLLQKSRSTKPPPRPKDGKYLFECDHYSKTEPRNQEPRYDYSRDGRYEWQYDGACETDEQELAKKKIAMAEELFEAALQALGSNVPSMTASNLNEWVSLEMKKYIKEERQSHERTRDEAVAKVKEDFKERWGVDV